MKQILFIDDEPRNVEGIRTVLGWKPELRCAIASGPDAALKMLKEERFDLIVTDVLMPGTDGITFAMKMRAGEYGENLKDMPIMFLTSDPKKVLRSGMSQYGNWEVIQDLRDSAVIEAIQKRVSLL
ncbi:MAG: response regulator [Elusimicrobiota bacterium]|jgi:CheY-like chemotaxis protein